MCYQHMERSITGMRQKEKENHNNFTGDLGVYCTGMMVVRSRVKDPKVNREVIWGARAVSWHWCYRRVQYPVHSLRQD